MTDGADGDNTQQDIRKRALDLLARREHAPAELAQKLRKRDYAADDIAAVLADLVTEDLLSPVRYAEAVVNARIARGQGPVRIRAELAHVQVDGTTIERAMAEAGQDWFALAAEVRRKRFGAELPHDYKARARQMRFLQRRGFDFDCIRAAMGED